MQITLPIFTLALFWIRHVLATPVFTDLEPSTSAISTGVATRSTPVTLLEKRGRRKTKPDAIAVQQDQQASASRTGRLRNTKPKLASDPDDPDRYAAPEHSKRPKDSLSPPKVKSKKLKKNPNTSSSSGSSSEPEEDYSLRVPLTNVDNEFFTLRATIRYKNFKFLVDTGSADFVVYSDQMKPKDIEFVGSTSKKVHVCRNAIPDLKFFVSYDDDSKYEGPMEFAEVRLGPVKGVKVENQAIGCVRQLAGGAELHRGYEGIFALGTKRHSSFKRQSSGSGRAKSERQSSWFENALTMGAFTKPVFTLDLIHSTDRGALGDSSLTFGRCMCKNPVEVELHDVPKTGEYNLILREGGLGNFDNIALDSGAADIKLPAEVVKAHFDKSGIKVERKSKHGDYYFPCSKGHLMRDLDLSETSEEQIKVVVPGKYLFMRVPKGDGRTCIGTLSETSGDPVYGVPFFMSVTTCFDQRASRLYYCSKSDRITEITSKSSRKKKNSPLPKNSSSK